MKKRMASLIRNLAVDLATDKEYMKYTLLFFGMMMGLYLFFIFGNASGATFTYSEF